MSFDASGLQNARHETRSSARSTSSSGDAVSVCSVRSNRASYSPWRESAERQFSTPSGPQRGAYDKRAQNLRRAIRALSGPASLPGPRLRSHPLRRRGLRRDALTVTRQSRLVFPLSEIIAALSAISDVSLSTIPATDCRARRPATASPRVSTRLFLDDLQTNPASLTITLGALFRPMSVASVRRLI